VSNISAIEPKELWTNFAALNAVPRPSKKEERVIQFMKEYGESLGLETMVDHIGNVIIKKPATAGMEDRQTIVMQSHLDMVHQKNADTVFDFDTEGIRMIVDGDWIHADGTTLGADNGIGVATIPLQVLILKKTCQRIIRHIRSRYLGSMVVTPVWISTKGWVMRIRS